MNRIENPELCVPVNWGHIMGTKADGKVFMGDIDGMLERKGRFLMVEYKNERVDDHYIRVKKQGQWLAYNALQALDDMTVVYVFGDPQGYEISSGIWLSDPGRRRRLTNEAFTEWVRQWWRWATENPSMNFLQGVGR